MNKKGAEELLINVINITLIGMILVIFIAWISGLATGKISQSEVLSKEIALLIDAAKPETSLFITHDSGEISLNSATKEILVSIGENEFSYDYFSKYKVSIQKINETSSIIKIEQ